MEVKRLCEAIERLETRMFRTTINAEDRLSCIQLLLETDGSSALIFRWRCAHLDMTPEQRASDDGRTFAALRAIFDATEDSRATDEHFDTLEELEAYLKEKGVW